ncbi:hypothetical protein KM043_006239 [Ampulex compressa]|nr:hypothetical protein KM043_006239 [Ampulex compressa]
MKFLSRIHSAAEQPENGVIALPPNNAGTLPAKYVRATRASPRLASPRLASPRLAPPRAAPLRVGPPALRAKERQSPGLGWRGGQRLGLVRGLDPLARSASMPRREGKHGKDAREAGQGRDVAAREVGPVPQWLRSFRGGRRGLGGVPGSPEYLSFGALINWPVNYRATMGSAGPCPAAAEARNYRHACERKNIGDLCGIRATLVATSPAPTLLRPPAAVEPVRPDHEPPEALPRRPPRAPWPVRDVPFDPPAPGGASSPSLRSSGLRGLGRLAGRARGTGAAGRGEPLEGRSGRGQKRWEGASGLFAPHRPHLPRRSRPRQADWLSLRSLEPPPRHPPASPPAAAVCLEIGPFRRSNGAGHHSAAPDNRVIRLPRKIIAPEETSRAVPTSKTWRATEGKEEKKEKGGVKEGGRGGGVLATGGGRKGRNGRKEGGKENRRWRSVIEKYGVPSRKGLARGGNISSVPASRERAPATRARMAADPPAKDPASRHPAPLPAQSRRKRDESATESSPVADSVPPVREVIFGEPVVRTGPWRGLEGARASEAFDRSARKGAGANREDASLQKSRDRPLFFLAAIR